MCVQLIKTWPLTIAPCKNLSYFQVSGWGRITNKNWEVIPNLLRFKANIRTLRKLEMPMIDGDICAKNEHFTNFKPDLQLCAGGEKGM